MPIPNSYDDCGAADKMLIDKRDAKVGWPEIRKLWREITKHPTLGTSTLPNRYSRLKQNFVVIREDDNGHLITAKREVEKAHTDSKWEKIAKRVVELGGEKYEVCTKQPASLLRDMVTLANGSDRVRRCVSSTRS